MLISVSYWQMTKCPDSAEICSMIHPSAKVDSPRRRNRRAHAEAEIMTMFHGLLEDPGRVAEKIRSLRIMVVTVSGC